ncbi:MAG TPA: autotransporter assembly complex family protein [Paucimonas sp.]|nr:autotransporter assembly complex family protein [Paucimonas sp.]
MIPYRTTIPSSSPPFSFMQRLSHGMRHGCASLRHGVTAWLLGMAAFFSCFPLPAHAQGQQSIAGYAVEINGAGELTALLNDYLDIARHATDAAMSRAELQRLAGSAPQQIRELLATEGYFSPAVRHALQQENGRWIARFDITPGPVTHIDAVDIRFSGDIAAGPHADQARMDRLRRRWRLDPGQPFRQAAWNEAKNALLKGLLNQDFPAAKITHSEARIDPERHIATLEIELDSGPLFTFGPLEIQGLKRYSRERIDALNPIRDGEPFSQDKLTELQARLQDSGYFRTVFATIDIDPAHPQHVSVRLDLTENERRRLALGIGFSTDSGPRVQTKWLDRNFLGHDWRLESELRLDRQTRVLGADVYFPARASGWYPSLGTHYERTDIANEVDNKMRIDARMTGPVRNDEEIWGASYLTEQQRIGDAPVNHRQAVVGTYTYTRRRIDDPISPRRGYVASIELAAGPRGLLNEANIGRVLLRGNWLSPTRRRWQLQARTQVGQVIGASREAVPGDLLFRTGGDQTVRGYAYNSLGVEQSGAVVGGRVLAIFSAELVYHLTPTWGAAVFRDAGNAADSWHDFRLKQGTGVGARWRSPIGPVNLDVAYGHATRQPRLHFSIGYGF